MIGTGAERDPKYAELIISTTYHCAKLATHRFTTASVNFWV